MGNVLCYQEWKLRRIKVFQSDKTQTAMEANSSTFENIPEINVYQNNAQNPEFLHSLHESMITSL